MKIWLCLLSCSKASFLVLDIRFLKPQSLHELLSQVLSQPKHTLIRDHSVRPALLIIAMTIYKLPISINLETSKDILRLCYPPKIRHMPLIAHMYEAATVAPSCSSLT